MKDLRSELMKKVVAYEERRVGTWLVWFMGIIGLLLVGTVFSLWYVGTEVIRRQTFELLSLFREDWEIIAEFWQDTAAVVWEELPGEWLFVALFLVILGCIFLLVTAKDRHKMARRIRDLVTREPSRT